MGFSGGYADTQLDANTFRVTFRGNGYTDAERVQDFLMYRCAELTKQSGNDYFVILSTGTQTSQTPFTTPGLYTATTTGQVTAYGNTAYGTATTTGIYQPGQTFNITKYGGTAIIKVFKGKRPEANLSAFDAAQVMWYLGDVVGVSAVAVPSRP